MSMESIQTGTTPESSVPSFFMENTIFQAQEEVKGSHVSKNSKLKRVFSLKNIEQKKEERVSFNMRQRSFSDLETYSRNIELEDIFTRLKKKDEAVHLLHSFIQKVPEREISSDPESHLESIAQLFCQYHASISNEKEKKKFFNTLKHVIHFKEEVCRALVCKIYKKTMENKLLGEKIYKKYTDRQSLEEMVFSLIDIDMKMMDKIGQVLFREDVLSVVIMARHLRNLLRKFLKNLWEITEKKLKETSSIDAKKQTKEEQGPAQKKIAALIQEIVLEMQKIDIPSSCCSFMKKIVVIIQKHPNNKELKEESQIKTVLINNVIFLRCICCFLIEKKSLRIHKNEEPQQELLTVIKVFQGMANQEITTDSQEMHSMSNFQTFTDKFF